MDEHVCVDGEYFTNYVGGMRTYYDEYLGKTKGEILKKAHFK